jgi:hypothetical protein
MSISVGIVLNLKKGAKMTKKYRRELGSKRSQGAPTPKAPQNKNKPFKECIEAIDDWGAYAHPPQTWWQKVFGGGK